MDIKAITFDLGNVVLTSDLVYHSPAEIKEFCDYFQVTTDNMQTGFSVSFPDFSLGKVTEDEFWTKFLWTIQANKTDIEFAKAFFRKCQKADKNMLSLITALKKTYRIASLTTITKDWLEFKREKFKLDNYFEIIVSSSEFGVRKPEPRIYEILIDKLKLNPQEILFIDDRETSFPPAEKLGIQTILFRGQQDLEENLRKLNIQF
jgi:haloacid dehalogenase superfamily, subfamily IA, variant 3 with third motif having DD or ED/haloacid dehalogenase superfamily, subfamily IA, variant 1 with third motif having Dx(3-4)D or Dx(3-4)E